MGGAKKNSEATTVKFVKKDFQCSCFFCIGIKVQTF